MKACISYNGGMVFDDSENNRHIFCNDEVEFLTTLFYKYRQSKPKGKGISMSTENGTHYDFQQSRKCRLTEISKISEVK